MRKCVHYFTFLNKKKHIHRGEVLAAIVSRSGQTIKEVANRAGYSRAAYYSHTKNPNLSFDILEQYGKALSVDFTDHFPEMVKYLSYNIKNENLTLEQAIKERDLWKDKYLNLLEKYNYLVEEKLAIKK